jgi:DHA3 family macrolide efflux protein-like MFS transporter
MQGRFFTVLMSISQAATPVGLLIAGPLSDRFGVQLWFLLASVAILIMCAVMLLTPSLRQLEDGAAVSPSPLPEAAPVDVTLS